MKRNMVLAQLAVFAAISVLVVYYVVFGLLYVSFTNASAFSPSDTLPLTRWAKLLMLVQSWVSIVTVVLVAARAVSMLG